MLIGTFCMQRNHLDGNGDRITDKENEGDPTLFLTFIRLQQLIHLTRCAYLT